MATLILKLKKDGTPKKSGGARTGAGKPMKISPDYIEPWDKQLPRALRLACSNHFELPRESFFTKREIKTIFGNKALTEFSKYFKSKREFDQAKGEKIRQRLAMGKFKDRPASWPEKANGYYTPEKYAEWLIKNTCFSWVNEVHSDHRPDVYLEFGDSGKMR